MKTVRKTELPKCDFCPEKAEYDNPTVQGPWANMCPACYGKYGSGSIGFRFILGVAAPKKDKVRIAPRVDEDECVCPNCGESRTVEPDANYEFDCEGCGQRCKVRTCWRGSDDEDF